MCSSTTGIKKIVSSVSQKNKIKVEAKNHQSEIHTTINKKLTLKKLIIAKCTRSRCW